MWRGISAFKGVVPQVTASGCDQHNTATRLHVGTPLRLEPDPGLEFGTVLLGRTLDAETSEHDLQERYDNRDSATCCRITIGRRGALASWQAGKLASCQEGGMLLQGHEGQGGLGIQAWQTYSTKGCR